MSILGLVLSMLIFLLLNAFYNEIQNAKSSNNETIHSFLTNTWSSQPNSFLIRKYPLESPRELSENTTSTLKSNTTLIINSLHEGGSYDHTSLPLSLVSYEKNNSTSQSSLAELLNLLLEPPSTEVMGDWSVVPGVYKHYKNQNWEEFVYTAGFPMFFQIFLADASETITIRRIQDKKKNGKKKWKNSNYSKDFKMHMKISSWLITHRLKFFLGETFTEHDPDGIDSQTTIFFSAPRLLIQDKIKPNIRIVMVYHFNETDFILDVINKDKLIMARRFFKRVK